MNNFILSINVVAPLFLTIMFGYFIRKINLVDDYTLKKINNLIFKTFLPMLLFFNIYNTKIEGTINIKLMIFASSAILISCIGACILIPFIEKDNKKSGVMVQAIFRSNFVLFGLPVVLSLFGEEGTGVTSILIAVIVPMFNFLAVIVLEIFRGGKINLKKIIKGIITNPLILASAIGVLMLVLQIKLPSVLEKTISDMSKVATPLALAVLGGSFKIEKINKNIKQLIIGVVGKLVIVPLTFIPIAIYLGFRNVELASIMIMLSAPVAVSSFTMAEQMDADGELAAQLVVFTSMLSVITIFIYIFVMKQLCYM
ncbi:AEC family transporter [uncultured Clostridium sp.]|uniref:AEC family transporter n=1 Tax=uncultured Clostridium sp. TaxID=59620 RepID=UPI0025EDCB71|nr:AEC family transporter [uncultured Clostridium sp.]